MSSAARDPLPADELPPLLAAQAMISEALPDPPPGPERDRLAAEGAARVDRAVAMMNVAIESYNERLVSVVEARMRSPKTRKGTRWWSQSKALVAAHSEVETAREGATPQPQLSPHQVKSASGRGVIGSSAHISGVEVKALDGSYVLPQRILDELGDAVRPVALRIVADASAAVARSLGRPNVGLATFDWRAVENAVDSVVSRMLDVNERHARDVRREILAADATAETLDEAIDRVMEATKRGGRWLLLNGRTLATALAGDAALGAARALGVTHTQWISRRDGNVRSTHVTADGQERPIGSKFQVGAFRLRFPADPSDLPASWPEVAGCRCSLLFARPAPERRQAVALAERGTPAAARRVIHDGAIARGPVVLGAPELRAGLSVPAVPLPESVVGYRSLDTELDVTPGQRISWPGTLALALAPPATAATVLVVALPVGAMVGVAAGAAVLAENVVLTVVSVSAGQVVAVPVAA